MIGNIPNVYEALYLQSIAKKQNKIFPNMVSKKEFNRGKKEAFHLGAISNKPFLLQTIIDKDEQKGEYIAFQKPEGLSNKLFNMGVIKLPKKLFEKAKEPWKNTPSIVGKIFTKSNNASFKQGNIEYKLRKTNAKPNEEYTLPKDFIYKF